MSVVALSRWRAPAIRVGIARYVTDADDDVVHRQTRRALTFGNSELRSQTPELTLALVRTGEIAGDEGDFGVETSPSERRRYADAVGQHFLRIERRNVGRYFGHRQRKIAGYPHEAARSDDLAVAHAGGVGIRMIWRATLARLLFASRSLLWVPLRRSASPADAPQRSHFDRSGTAAKLVSPSSEAKTAPPMRAAPHKPGQDRAARTIARKCAADRSGRRCRRRPKAEVRCRDRASRPPPRICAAPLAAWSKTAVPPHSRPTVQPSDGSPVCLRTIALSFAPRSWQRRRCPHQSNQGDWTGRDHSATFRGAPPGMRIPRRELCKNGGGMWPQCGARTGFNGRICGGLRKLRVRGLVCSAKRPSYRRCQFKVRILTRWRLTMARAEAYIGPLDAPPPWRDDASAKPLTVYTVNHPASPVAMSDVRASAAPVLTGDGALLRDV